MSQLKIDGVGLSRYLIDTTIVPIDTTPPDAEWMTFGPGLTKTIVTITGYFRGADRLPCTGADRLPCTVMGRKGTLTRISIDGYESTWEFKADD